MSPEAGQLQFHPYRVDPNAIPLPTRILATRETYGYATTISRIGNDQPFDSGAISYELIEAVYSWFEVTYPVPYSSKRRIEPDLFSTS